MNLRSLNSSSMQGASFDREIASGLARKAISQDGEAVRSDSSAVAVDDAQVARTTSAPVVLRVGFKAGKMTAGKHGEDPEVSEAVRRLQKSRLGYRFTKPRSEPSAQAQGGPGLPVLLGAQGARRLQRPGHHAPRHSGHVAPAHEQALEARRRAGRKPQARMVARRVRPRLPDGRPRQGEGQAWLLPVLLREEEAREADKARLAPGPSARKEWGRRAGASCP